MESKKINQLATEMSPATSDLTIIGDPITGVSKKITLLQIADLFQTTGTVSSVAVTETGDALTITGSPITTAGTINIGFAGDATQYVRGDGALADFPTSTGGGSSVSYYLNSSVSQGTIGGVAYRQLSKTPISGAGTDITASTNGYIASYITDANDPALLEVPAGNFNCEFYFSVNSNNHDPYVYAELYKYDGTTFTLLGSNVAIPQYLTNGTTLSAYYFAIPVAVAALTITDRIAIRIYVNVDGRVVTLHTENNHLCQVVTTFSKGLISLNNLTRQNQFFATGTSGTDFNISSATATHTFNLPVASATNTGKLSSTDWSTFNGKVPYTGATTDVDLGVNSYIGQNLFIKSSINNIPWVTNYLKLGYIKQSTTLTFTLGVDTGNVHSLIFTSGNSYAYTFPNTNGTIALTSDLSGYVTLATTQTISGAKTFSSSPIIDNGTSGIPLRFKQYSSTNFGLAGYTDIIPIGATLIAFAFGQTGADTKIAYFSAASLTNNVPQEYTLPNATGTIALLSGTQTFTGATTFSSDITVNGVRVGKGAGSISGNTALGVSSLNANTTGNQNTALGYGTLAGNLIGNGNTAIGYTALSNNTNSANTAIGYAALVSNTTGFSNVAVGYNSMVNSNGNENTAIGNQSMQLNTNGVSNTAIGHTALQSNTTGNNNIAIGYESGINITTGSNNTIIGKYAGTTTLANNIVLADGAGNIRYQWNGTNNVFGNPISGTSATFSSSVTAASLIVSAPATTTYGSLNAITSSYAYQEYKYNGTAYGYIGQQSSFISGASNTDLGIVSVNNLIFGTSGSFNERMRITSAGNVGIGTSTTGFNAAGLPLVVGSGSGNTGLTIFSGASSAGSIHFADAETTGAGSYAGFINYTHSTNSMQFGTTGATPTEAMRITSGGEVYIAGTTDQGAYNLQVNGTGVWGAGAYVNGSDLRLKENISDLDNSLELIKKMKPVTYNYKESYSKDNSTQTGFIAQDLKELFKNKKYIDGIVKQGNEYMSVAYQNIIPLLVKSIQEQQAQIEELKALINK